MNLQICIGILGASSFVYDYDDEYMNMFKVICSPWMLLLGMMMMTNKKRVITIGDNKNA